ncbi:MAG: L,D-transpeptidase family protein [Synechococcales bacterium]|nr:L,D-transpeptidase family protein [Synechococcales bacterium]
MLLSFLAAGLVLSSQIYSGLAESSSQPGRSPSLASLWPFGNFGNPESPPADTPPPMTPVAATYPASATIPVTNSQVSSAASPPEEQTAQSRPSPSTPSPSTAPPAPRPPAPLPASSSPELPSAEKAAPNPTGQAAAVEESSMATFSNAPVRTLSHEPETAIAGANSENRRLAALLPLAQQVTQTIPPEEKLHLVVDLSDRQVFFYRDGVLQTTYGVAVGRQGWETPVGEFYILEKQVDPTWRHPFTGKLVPPGPDNPLGSRWIGFWTDGTDQIGFHGTNQTQFIGQAVSHGCLRMREADIQALYPLLEIGTPVTVRP